MQSLLVDEKKYQNELLKKEDSIKEQAKRTAINRWLSNSQAIFFEKTKEVVWPLLQDYFETIPRHLEEYLEKRLSSQTLIIERENERLEKMLLLKPDKVEKDASGNDTVTEKGKTEDRTIKREINFELQK